MRIIKWIVGVAIVYFVLYILVHTVMPKSISDTNPTDISRAIAYFVSAGLVIIGSTVVAIRMASRKKH